MLGYYFRLKTIAAIALIFFAELGRAGEPETWSQVMDATYPMGSDTTMAEAMTQLREDLRGRAMAQAGEYVAGRKSLDGEQLSKHLDRVQGGTVSIEMLEREMVMSDGYPALKVRAEVSVNERDVVRFLNQHQEDRESIRGQVEAIDRSSSMPAASVLDDELKALRKQADKVSQQLRENFAARVFVDPILSVDANKARFKVRVLWQTAAPALFEMDLIEPYMVPGWQFDYREYINLRWDNNWPVHLSPKPHRWYPFLRSGLIWDDYIDTLLAEDARDEIPISNWEKLDIWLEPIESNTREALLRQAALLFLAQDQLDVVLEIGDRQYRHPVASGYCADNEDIHDWLEAVDTPRSTPPYPDGLLGPSELPLRDKEPFNQWNEVCRPTVTMRFTPGTYEYEKRGEWDEFRDPDRIEAQPFGRDGKRVVAQGWSDQMESPHEDFPGLAWEFTVTLGPDEDPDSVSLFLKSRKL